MKLFITALLATVLSFGFTDGRGPIITFQKESHDFGRIPQGKPVTYDFEFTNTGDEPLVLVEVKASCGCTTPSYPTEPIAPGKSGKIKVVYNAAAPRTFHKSVTVISNMKEADNVTNVTKVLFIKGEVFSDSLEEKKEEAPKSPVRQN